MANAAAWPQVESEVHRPGRALALAAGILFLLAGSGILAALGPAAPPGAARWLVIGMGGLFALAGGGIIAWAATTLIVRVRILHAAPDVLPEVPKGPVLCEGMVVHGRVTHELCEDESGWRFLPAKRHWRNDKRFLFGFGVPFSLFSAGLLTWVFHDQQKIGGWALSAFGAIAVTAVCGGSTFVLIGMMMRASYRRLPVLVIPRGQDAIELESADEPSNEPDVMQAVQYILIGDATRHKVSIPRHLLVAVQLCPWNYAVQNERAWAVQGLLVLANPNEPTLCRLPILLTSDYVGAARLMQRLARVLEVPYLFCADREGWKAEKIRSKGRRPLRSGGTMS